MTALPPLHPQIRALIEAQETEAGEEGPPSLEALRAGYVRTAIERGGAIEPVDAVEDVVIPRPDGGRVRGRVYVPQGGSRVGGRLVWLHGGGWCIGDLDGIDRVCRALANAGGAETVAVDYRLAPEHPFPAPLDDVRAAVAWAGREGPLVVGGDSAGGNLAAVAVRRARDEDGAPAIAGQALVYPPTDAAMEGASYEDGGGPMLGREEMRACWAAYGSGAAADDPDLSPLRAADLTGLPPTLVVVAGHDVLRSDGEAYAAALRDAGVEVTLSRYEDMTHGFIRWGGVVDRTRELIGEIGAFAAACLPPRAAPHGDRPA